VRESVVERRVLELVFASEVVVKYVQPQRRSALTNIIQSALLVRQGVGVDGVYSC
jgi:hypothetical protein